MVQHLSGVQYESGQGGHHGHEQHQYGGVRPVKRQKAQVEPGPHGVIVSPHIVHAHIVADTVEQKRQRQRQQGEQVRGDLCRAHHALGLQFYLYAVKHSCLSFLAGALSFPPACGNSLSHGGGKYKRRPD